MAALAGIQKDLAAGELSVALRKLDELLASDPDHVDGLYLQAVAYRYLQSHDKALDALRRLKVLSPSHSRAHQEEGHVQRDQGNQQAALHAYSRALALNPALESSLRESVILLNAAGHKDQALQRQAQLTALRELPRPLQSALDLVAQNKLLKAEAVCRKFLQQQPQHIQAMRLLADIGMRLGILEDAEFLLESAATFAPDDLQVQMDYVQVLRKRQKFQAGLKKSQQLLVDHPENLQVRSLCAIEHMQTGDFKRAMILLDDVLEQLPADPRTLVTYGHALKTSGRADAAVDRYRQAIASQPLHGESYYSLANLKVYQFEDQEVERMQTLETNDDLGFMDRVYVNFALAKAFEDRGDYGLSLIHI